MKRQATNWEKIFPSHISNKELDLEYFKTFKKKINSEKSDPQMIQLENGQKT